MLRCPAEVSASVFGSSGLESLSGARVSLEPVDKICQPVKVPLASEIAAINPPVKGEEALLHVSSGHLVPVDLEIRWKFVTGALGNDPVVQVFVA